MKNIKKLSLLLAVVLLISAAVTSCCMNELYKCIKDIYYADVKNSNIQDLTKNLAAFDMSIKDMPLLDIDAFYNIAENHEYTYYYCENQYLELSSDNLTVRYFYYDRQIGAPTKGEGECRKAALSAVGECTSGRTKVQINIIGTAFDGYCYIYSVSLGEYGTAVVGIAADSGKIILFDGRNINFF